MELSDQRKYCRMQNFPVKFQFIAWHNFTKNCEKLKSMQTKNNFSGSEF